MATETQIRQSVINAAVSYLGTRKGSTKHHEIIDLYNSHTPRARGYKLQYTDDWCDGFVSAVAVKTGHTDLIGTEVGVGRHIDIFKAKGIWKESDSFVPSTGDIIVYDWDDNGVGDDKTGASHIGYVVSCDGKTIKVIEGNKGYESVVGYRTIAVNGRYIRGFAHPNYASKATKEPAKATTTTTKTTTGGTCKVEMRVLKKGMSGNDCRMLMVMLKDKGYYSGVLVKSDKTFGPICEAAVKKFQKAKGLTVDGVANAKTLAALLAK